MDDDMVIGLNLNRQPLIDQSPPAPSPSPPRLASLLDEPETSQSGIEDRIRQLEAISARANHRQRWRRFSNNPELNYTSVIDSTNENQGNNGVSEAPIEERSRNCKRDISQLAKALEMDLDSKKIDNGVNGNFFDCNICLDVAKDPILTCCGHLFCWGCFYQVPYVDSISKECPTCKGEVIDSNITPIYGNGNGKNSQVSELESGLKIPPRPRARRVEGVRQQNFFTGVSHIPVADALRRIRLGLGLIDENAHPLIGLVPTSAANRPLLNGSEAEESREFSGVISERFVEDLESYVSVADTTVRIQSEPQSEMNLSRRDLGATVLQMGTLGNDGFVEIDFTISRRGSSRRRGVSNLEGQSSLELRRR